MKILFITTVQSDKQGDLLEVSLLHGLRKVLKDGLIDYPKKKVMYHDFSDTPKDSLHGRGFSLLTYPLEDVKDRSINQKFDAAIYGDGHMYGERCFIPEIDYMANNNVWVIDGHDLYGDAPRKVFYDGEFVIGNQFRRSFKRELILQEDEVYPTGFGIPEERILPIDLSKKDQAFQKTAPADSTFQTVNDLGGREHHKFTVEDEYYNDLSRSWFGLTCKKGGWDCLRHYEILAAGSLLLFKNYDKKPPLCSPQDLPCFTYSTQDELNTLINTLVINNVPTTAYHDMIAKQREWLYNHGTTIARAKHIIGVIQQGINNAK